MTKILVVAHDSSLYGAQRSLLDAVCGLRSRGFDIHVCVPNMGPFVEQLSRHSIDYSIEQFGLWIPTRYIGGVRYCLGYIVRFPWNLLRLRFRLRELRPDIVYTNTITVIDFALAAKLAGIPHVWHLRESAEGNPQLRSLIGNRNVSRIAGFLSKIVLYNSEYLAKRYSSQLNWRQRVVYNGFSTEEVGRNDLGRRDQRLHLVTAGYMEPRKGLDVLLDAILLLPKDQRSRFKLTIAGHIDGSYLNSIVRPKLLDIDRQGGCEIDIIGWVDNLAGIFSSADLLVSSARDEPFGRTLVEAMLCGVAVLATRSGGPEEIVLDSVTGRLVPSDDAVQLASALAELIASPRMLREMGAAGRRRAAERFSMSSYIDALSAVMNDAAGR